MNVGFTTVVAAALLVVACGGGGGGSTGDEGGSGSAPNPPVSAASSVTAVPITPATGDTVQALCNPLDYAYQAGHTAVATMIHKGLVEGTGTTTVVNRGAESFEGRNAFETEVTIDSPGDATSGRTLAMTKTYSERTAPTETTTYGGDAVFEGDSPLGRSILRGRVVQTPPLVDKRYGLKAGESLTLNWRERTTSSGTIGSLSIPPKTTDVSFDQQVTFVGLETITVPAGTFRTCRFEGKITTSTSEWWLVGYPFQIKLIERDTAGVIKQTSEAQSITVNGTRL